ncbi:hypothetical protein ACQP00_02460 [Dactylosporangium sp. CS-047395]|uniref:hypothetical protein n=1 Tax=Dactylosporangium sp. CS-047395 TaxID=3239936 RepID=UPI003D8CFC51
MRSRTTRWLLAGVLTLSLDLNMAFILRELFHESFARGLATALVSNAALLLAWHISNLEKRRRAALPHGPAPIRH